mmetsp:Transcript_23676/g.41946  ORF Transcript_23676/g.41946 Transcript_23676/m.41946 type:complete len:80 (+) Transcript_23676:57-296(+)
MMHFYVHNLIVQVTSYSCAREAHATATTTYNYYYYYYSTTTTALSSFHLSPMHGAFCMVSKNTMKHVEPVQFGFQKFQL